MDWREAEQIIGTQNRNDYVLDVAEHRARYEADCPELAELMAYAGTAEHAANYVDFDLAAIDAQIRYKRWMRCANLGAFFTSVFTASAMALQSAGAGLLVTVLSFFALVAAAIGSAGLVILRNGKLLEIWMNRRAMAETHRIMYFESILTRAVARPSPAPILALEYYGRYQFAVQKNFLYNRAKQHEKSAGVTVLIGAIGAAVASLSASIALLADDSFTLTLNELKSFAGFFAIFGAALGAYAIGREQMTQDRRNAERYLRTHAALVGFATKFDEVREAVVAGRPDAAYEFASAVDDQISNEHRQWLDSKETAQAAIARIEKALGGPAASEHTS